MGKPKSGLCSKLESLQRTAKKKGDWLSALPAAQQAELLEYRRKYRTGQLENVPTDGQIYEAVRKETGTPIGQTCFYDWLKRRPL